MYSGDIDDTKGQWEFSSIGTNGLFNLCPVSTINNEPYYKYINRLLLGILKPNTTDQDILYKVLECLYNCIYNTMYGFLYNDLTELKIVDKRQFVWRGENHDWNNIASRIKNSKFTISSFFSTTHDIYRAIEFTHLEYNGDSTQKKIIYIIDISEISRYLYISKYSIFPDEKEWLLLPFTNLEITQTPKLERRKFGNIMPIYCKATYPSELIGNEVNFKNNLKKKNKR